MATIEGAILEWVEIIQAVDGIQNVPDTPLEQVTSTPQVMIYNTDGFSLNEPNDIEKSLHNVQLAVVMPLSNLSYAIKTMLPLYEKIVKALWDHRNSRASANAATFEQITYTFGIIEWAQLDLYGYIFTLNNVKIWNNL